MNYEQAQEFLLLLRSRDVQSTLLHEYEQGLYLFSFKLPTMKMPLILRIPRIESACP